MAESFQQVSLARDAARNRACVLEHQQTNDHVRIATLESELAAAKIGISRREDAARELVNQLTQSQNEIDMLASEKAELFKDKERLEWLVSGDGAMPIECIEEWWDEAGDFRGAIDEARGLAESIHCCPECYVMSLEFIKENCVCRNCGYAGVGETG